MLTNLLKPYFRANTGLINIIKKLAVYLLCFALLSGCAVRNSIVGNEQNQVPWELQFRYRHGEPTLPLHILNLNRTIMEWEMDISRIIPAWNESHIIVVTYKGLSKAKVQEIYNRLKEEASIEVLGMTQTH